MRKPDEPLEYPAHYPPVDRWKKFFIGVPGFGPDLSFFKDLRGQQAARTPDCMKAWTTAQEHELATIFGRAFQKGLRWPTPFFLPDDKLNAIFGGPKFQSIDFGDAENVLAEVGQQLHTKLPKQFWRDTHVQTLGQLVAEVIEALAI
jgi:hypothetical protein